MSESQIRALFTEIADGGRPFTGGYPARPPPGPGPPALAPGLRGRHLGAGRGRGRDPCHGGRAGPARFRPARRRAAAPRQFNPLVPYLSFGWLPAGNRLLAGGARPELTYLTAGRNLTSRPRGTSRSTRPASATSVPRPGELKCSTQALEGLTARIIARAPTVRGHLAFWAGPYLVWQYARGGWAGLLLPTANISPKLSAAQREADKREAVKIADHVRYGAATPPLVFPAQLTRLPSRWR